MQLPRLRVRGWLTVSASAGSSTSAGGEIGLVMPLDSTAASAAAVDDAGDGDDTDDDGLSDAASHAVARVVVTGPAAPCRLAAACRWERTERARALARAEEGGP